MNKAYRSIAVLLALLLLCTLCACAPSKFQGSFKASFSLTECQESDNHYQYDFYADGQATEKNTANGTAVSFTYTASGESLTVSTEDKSFTYEYDFDGTDSLTLTYQEGGQSKSTLLERKK